MSIYMHYDRGVIPAVELDFASAILETSGVVCWSILTLGAGAARSKVTRKKLYECMEINYCSACWCYIGVLGAADCYGAG
jgi:hypothetical protein